MKQMSDDAFKNNPDYLKLHKNLYLKKSTGEHIYHSPTNTNYKPGIDPPSYKKDNLKPGEFNPKDIGIDGYEHEGDIVEDYKPTKEKKF